MAEKTIYTYNPDYCAHPGDYLEEVLEMRGMKKRDIAERLDITVKTISQIINRKAYITPEMSLQFERVLGISASIWNNMSSSYRLFEARIDENKELEKNVSWLKCFPIKDLQHYGLLPDFANKKDILEALLAFFGVSSPEVWDLHYKRMLKNVCCKKSEVYHDNIYHMASWMRAGELAAQKITTKPYSKDLLKKQIQIIRGLTVQKVETFENKMVKLCADAGVALVFVPEFDKTHIWGITKWIGTDKAMILMSLRYKTNDHFWFTFFHEAGHILLHGKKDIFIDSKKTDKSEQETNANDFSANIMIPQNEYLEFIKMNDFSLSGIIRFANKTGIHPGIVVGRIQHEALVSYSDNNQLKVKFEFKNMPGM